MLRGPRRRRSLLLILVTVAASGCGDGSSSRTDEVAMLPLRGESATGQRYRLQAAPPHPKGTWCLKLKYAKDIGLQRGDKIDRLTGGASTCGPRPQAPVSGLLVADCERRSVFIFGGARARAGTVSLTTSQGKRIPARRGELPRGSGFRGTTFLIAASIDDLPARLRSSGGGLTPEAAFPRKSRLCRPLPGNRHGGEPFGDFP